MQFEKKSTWAELVEEDRVASGVTNDVTNDATIDVVKVKKPLPSPYEEFDPSTGIKKVFTYKYNEDGKKVVVIKTYKVETRKVPEAVAKRKLWKKFGEASHDPPGPNSATTIVSEDVFIQFVKNLQEKEESKEQKLLTCRICKGYHLTIKCPHKDALEPENKSQNKLQEKYIPPNMRNSAISETTDKLTTTLRVDNLSPETEKSDVHDLFKSFGTITRIFMGKDKFGTFRGFAFVNFSTRREAEIALIGIDGFGYDNLILSVEWAKTRSIL